MATAAYLQQAYLAYFGRPADITGLAAFANATNAQVQAAFSASAESIALYGTNVDANFINSIYVNVLGRAAEPAGITYWLNQIAIGAVTPAGAAIAILNGAQGTDVTTVTNKLAAATLFTAGLDTNAEILAYSGTAAAASARSFLAGITATAATQAQVDAAIVAVVSNGGATGSTFTFTTSLDNLTGTGANDTFNATLADTGAGAYSPTGSTLQLGDAADGGAGTDTLNVTSNVTVAYTASGYSLKNIETVNINNVNYAAGTALTFDAASTPQVTAVNATGIGDLTVTNIGTAAIGLSGITISGTAGTAHTITAKGANTINLANTTIATGATDTLALTVAGAASTGTAQAVVLNSAGTAANKISTLTIGNLVDGASSLTINASQALTIATIAEQVANKLKTVTISGAETGTVSLGTLTSTALTSVDASGLTVGGTKVGIGANVATTFKGGVGNDTLTIAAGVAMTGAADGGSGTNTLVISDNVAAAGGAVVDASLTAATKTLFTNFQTLQVAATSTGSGTQAATDYARFDSSLLSGLTSLNVGTSTSGVQITNLAASPTIKAVGNLSGVLGVDLVLKDATGTADAVNLQINNGNTATTGTNNGLTISNVKVAGVETLNISSDGLINGGGTANTISALDAGNTSLSKVVITGAQKLSLTTNGLVAAQNLTIDGAAATGALTISTAQTGKVNINGGSANDTFTLTAAATKGGLMYGAAGGDAITLGAAHLGETLVYKAAGDSQIDTLAATTTKMDTITNFATTKDAVDISAFAFTAAQKGALVYAAVAAGGATSALAAANAAAATWYNDATATARAVKVVSDGTDAFVFVDANKDGQFSATTDLVIKLAGLATADATTVALADIVF